MAGRFLAGKATGQTGGTPRRNVAEASGRRAGAPPLALGAASA